MISRKLSSPGTYFGTNINCEHTHVLLQIGDEDSQTRIKLTPEEVDKVIISLETRRNELLNDPKYKPSRNDG